MKKIIELAENYLVETRILTLEGDYYKCGVGYELAKAIAERRTLEQTPITEDWLKEHGFVVSNELHSKRDKIYIKENIKIYLDVDCRNGIVGYADCIEINGDSDSFHKDTYSNRGWITLAELYDALGLCNIQID